METKALTFKLIGEGPEYEAICKSETDKSRLTMQATEKERLYDPTGSSEGVEIFRFSDIRISNAFGYVVQKIQKSTPSKDVDIELSKEIADKILSFSKINPEKKYKLVRASGDGLF